MEAGLCEALCLLQDLKDSIGYTRLYLQSAQRKADQVEAGLVVVEKILTGGLTMEQWNEIRELFAVYAE